MTTNWTIHQLERKSDDGFVVNVHWRYSMTDTDQAGKNYYADTYSVASYTQDPEAESYVPYEELTKDIVVGWVTASLGEERMLKIEQSLTDQIAAQKNPPILTGLPWEPVLAAPLAPEEVVEEQAVVEEPPVEEGTAEEAPAEEITEENTEEGL
jgi:hypothetical protein